METNKYIIPPKFCTGCSLCANVCSKNAIKMILNADGFLVPTVNTSVCTNCGLCTKMCPAQPQTNEEKKSSACINTVLAYGGWNTNKSTVKKSSSGGIFSALAEQIFSMGGCVFGVVWHNKIEAAFCKAENIQELSPMLGSKYVQANPFYVYRDVKTELLRHRYVLFVGTSCQVHALKKYLRKPYEKLITIDIICAGVPSKHLLCSYITHIEETYNKQIKHINFRYKDNNWLQYKVQNIFEDGETISEYSGNNKFMNLFLSGLLLNKCCYKCPYISIPRQGDITLGDYWGIQHYNTNWPITDGISSIVVSSEKGTQIIELLYQKGIIQLHPQHFQRLYKGQTHSYNTNIRKQIPARRTHVLSAIKSQTLEQVHNTYYNYIQICGIKIHRKSFLLKITKIPYKILSLLKKLFLTSSQL